MTTKLLFNSFILSHDLEFSDKESALSLENHFEGEIVEYRGNILAIGGGIQTINRINFEPAETQTQNFGAFSTFVEVLTNNSWKFVDDMSPIWKISGRLAQFSSLVANHELYLFGNGNLNKLSIKF